jgi:Transglutaminase-like superfamily
MKIYYLKVALVFLLRCAGLAVPDIAHGEDQFQFTYRAVLPQLKANADIWLPLEKADAFQKVEIEHFSVPIACREVQDHWYKDEILHLSPGPNESGKTIQIDYMVRQREKGSYHLCGEVKQHLQPERLVLLNQAFKSIAANLISDEVTDMERGRALYDHVLSRMKYDESGTGRRRGDAVCATNARTGNCTEFAFHRTKS